MTRRRSAGVEFLLTDKKGKPVSLWYGIAGERHLPQPTLPSTQTAIPSAAPQSAGLSAIIEGFCPVVFKSTRAGADIKPDNKYVGSTPSTIHVPAGDHLISIEKAGFKTWQRAMTLIAGGEITVDASLEKGQ